MRRLGRGGADRLRQPFGGLLMKQQIFFDCRQGFCVGIALGGRYSRIGIAMRFRDGRAVWQRRRCEGIGARSGKRRQAVRCGCNGIVVGNRRDIDRHDRIPRHHRGLEDAGAVVKMKPLLLIVALKLQGLDEKAQCADIAGDLLELGLRRDRIGRCLRFREPAQGILRMRDRTHGVVLVQHCERAADLVQDGGHWCQRSRVDGPRKIFFERFFDLAQARLQFTGQGHHGLALLGLA